MDSLTQSLPAKYYYSPKFFQQERKNVFAKEWIYAAHANELKAPGDYRAMDLAGFPIVLLKDKDNIIRGFHNVCRHRAAPLFLAESGCLSSSLIKCRYHGWSYNLEGQLIHAPFCEKLSHLEAEDLSLFSVQVAVYRDFIFVNMDNKAPAFQESFAEFIQEVDQSNYPFEEYSYHSMVSREGNFNWKVWIDGYQECYHCMTIHPIFNKDFFLQKYQVMNKDHYSLHSCERKEESTSGSFKGLWLWRYPNLGLPCYENCFYTLQVNPIGPEKTKLIYTFHFKNSEDQKKITEFLQFVESITQEDISICEQVQKNLKAGVFQSGHLNPTRENGVHYFQSLIQKAVKGDLEYNQNQHGLNRFAEESVPLNFPTI